MSVRTAVMGMFTFAFVGCTGLVGEGVEGDDGELLTAADDEVATTQSALSSDIPMGTSLSTTANLNLRSGPGTSHSVRLVIPAGATVTTVNTASPSGGFYNVKYGGTQGWSSGQYLKSVPSTPAPSPTDPSATASLSDDSRAGAVMRAKSAVGGSYWWGHGKWYPFNQGGNNAAASCAGSCPNCSHSGSSGADCSGYVAKLWRVPSSNTTLSSDAHPYSTATFVSDSSMWRTVSRGSVIQGDALVYNQNGSGHIFLYDSADPWGMMYAYEAKGCAIGIVHDLRSATAAYHAIRHY